MLKINNSFNQPIIREQKPCDIVEGEEEFIDDTPKPSSNKLKNTLLASLTALSSLGIAGTCLGDNVLADIFDTSQKVEVYDDNAKYDVLVDEASQTKDSLVTAKDISSLVNYYEVDRLPRQKQKIVRNIVMSNLEPVKVGGGDEVEKIKAQVEKAQALINFAIDGIVSEYEPSPNADPNDYKTKYYTGTELCDDIDYTELKKWQSDTSVLDYLLKGSMQRTSRCGKTGFFKYCDQVKNAQSTVDGIVKKYEIRSRIPGNYDGNTTLTREEFLSNLNFDNLQGLSRATCRELINSVVPGCVPYPFDNVRTKKDADEMTKRIADMIQKAQDKLDEQASQIKLQQYVDRYGSAIANEGRTIYFTNFVSEN